MKMVPLLRVTNMRDALAFYTGVLDFRLKYPEASAEDWVVDLVNGDAEFQLTAVEGDQRTGIAVYVWVNDVDSLFQKYLARGLDTSKKKESPVHQGPVDQTWGRREFYVTDADGNTLRFASVHS
ncbi:MAG TPA: VOC family protein [Chitinophagaceae bacterium]|nr:VOC family protein [Chitinophagaceae bacterium]